MQQRVIMEGQECSNWDERICLHKHIHAGIRVCSYIHDGWPQGQLRQRLSEAVGIALAAAKRTSELAERALGAVERASGVARRASKSAEKASIL